MKVRSFVAMTALCAISALVLSSCSVAAEPAGAPAKSKQAGKNAPKAEELLRKMADYLASLPAFACNVNSSVHIQAGGNDNRMDTKVTLRIERPNRIAMIVERGVMGITIISDGKQLVEYIPMLHRYTVNDAPADFAELQESARTFGIVTMGMSGTIIPIDGEEFYNGLMEGMTSSENLGTEKIGGVLCHHLRFKQENLDWDIWIEDGERPLVHKIAPDLSKQLAAQGGSDGKIDFTVTFSDWNVDPKFTEADFSFDPPADAEKVDSLFKGLGGEEPGPHPLLGQEAPAFKTVSPDDEPINLKDSLGKKVILLDFWATWCGPCILAMPQVDEAAKKFADKDFVFYAVNSGEDAETVKEFLKSSELAVPVAMDMNGEIGSQYQVSGIPQTVLIGKDGKVQVVHVGFIDGLGEMLTSQIEDLLAGEDLAGPELEKFEKSKKEKTKADDADAPAEETPAEAPG